jgi:small subunit ribosomal protein S16
MLKIRLSRVGRTHEPVYRLVLTESTNAAKSGKSLEVLGSYDSRNSETAQFNAEKITYWLSKGAQLSDTAHNLLLRKGIITGAKRNVLPKRIIEAAKAPKESPTEPVVEAAPEGIPHAEIPEVATSEAVDSSGTEETADAKIEVLPQ